jgi:Fuseless
MVLFIFLRRIIPTMWHIGVVSFEHWRSIYVRMFLHSDGTFHWFVLKTILIFPTNIFIFIIMSSTFKAAFTSLPSSTVWSHIGIGMASASFWRGAWYILDDNLYPNDPLRSSISSWSLGVFGMFASQGLVQKADSWALTRATAATKHPSSFVRNVISIRLPQIARFAAIYSLAASCVLIWRGTWMMWDIVYEHGTSGKRATEPQHATYSGLWSHGIAIVGLTSCGLLASVLAPPAAIAKITNCAVTKATAAQPSMRIVDTKWFSSSLRNSMESSASASNKKINTVSSSKQISPWNDRVLLPVAYNNANQSMTRGNLHVK